jgi:hypothetical protein
MNMQMQYNTVLEKILQIPEPQNARAAAIASAKISFACVGSMEAMQRWIVHSPRWDEACNDFKAGSAEMTRCAGRASVNSSSFGTSTVPSAKEIPRFSP